MPGKENPLKHAKSLTVTRKIEIYHFFDYESDELLHVKGISRNYGQYEEGRKDRKADKIQIWI